MALYEITFLTKEETDPGVREAIEKAGGTITEESSLGRRRLAYPIKKETSAVYTTYVFDMVSRSVPTINQRLRLNSNVLRYLIVTKETAQAKKEVSKAVREAIAAAEKLEDTVAESKTGDIPVETTEIAEPVEVTSEPTIKAEEVMDAVREEIAEEKTAKPARKPRAKKAEAPADAAEATEEDRLKALEDKLGEILKD